jgi:hypothetical protein
MMDDSSLRTFANLEISCPMVRSPHRETSSSLELYMTRNKCQPQHQDQEEVSFVFPSNYTHKLNHIIRSDDTLTTCNTSMSTFHSTASGSSSAPITTHSPLHQEEAEEETTTAIIHSCTVRSLLKCSSPDQSRRRIKKQVRFRLDTDGHVLCAYLNSEGLLTDEEKQAVWWQPMEFKLFRRYCKKAAQLARNSEYSEQFTKVYDACSQKHITDVREHCHISRTHARGLEVVVFPTLVQARKLVVKGVVKTQEKLPPSMDADQRVKVLSATSRCLTGRSRLLSRVFAVGDEEIAKDCYYSMKG